MNNENYKFEFKYELEPATARFVEEEIKKFGMKPDRHAYGSDGSYFVSSLYFDSFDLFDYQEKAGGFLDRKKIRARIYEPFLDKSQHVWLEVKRKHDSKITKNRVKITRDEWERFSNDGISFLLKKNWDENELSDKNKFLENFIRFSAKPKVFVRYLRKPFLNQSENLRINFDYDLETCRKGDLGYNGFMTPVNRGIVIMEVKFSYLMPHWLGQIVKKYDLKKDAISKYGRSVEAIHRLNPIAR